MGVRMGDNSKAIAVTLNVIGMIVGIFVLTAGIMRFVYGGSGNDYILATYLSLFGIILFLLELKVFPFMYKLFGFLASWYGRGFFYIFCGTLSWVGNDWTLVFPITCFVCGVLWIILFFTKLSLPPPLLGGESPHSH